VAESRVFVAGWSKPSYGCTVAPQPAKHRGGGWAASALGSRLALGAAASTLSFLRAADRPSAGLFFCPLAHLAAFLAWFACAPAILEARRKLLAGLQFLAVFSSSFLSM
jgi:hypothetical protein